MIWLDVKRKNNEKKSDPNTDPCGTLALIDHHLKG